MKNIRVLFFGKKSDSYCCKALEFCSKNFIGVEYYLGGWKDSFPIKKSEWEGDLIISYLSRWIIPENLLKKAKIAAVNFHPASPEFPGAGCFNFALYNNSKEYGVTCHHMEPKVDTGKIIATKRFEIDKSYSLEDIINKTHFILNNFFYEVMKYFLDTGTFPESRESWSRKPYKIKQVDELSFIKPDMPKKEIERRIRATNYRNFKPFTIINGYKFELKKGD